MKEDDQDSLQRDQVEEAWMQTNVYIKRKLRRYGLLTLGNIAVMSLFLKGIPAHFLAPIFGMPLILSFAFFFTPTLYYGGLVAAEWLDRKLHP